MTIKNKLILLISTIFIGFVSLYFIENFTIKDIQRFAKIEENIKQMKIDQLELRKHEKDFLVRKDLKYKDNFDKGFKTIKNDINRLKKELEELKISTTNLTSLEKAVDKYNTIFQKLAKAQIKIGLNPEDGLYGELRDSVHKVQDNAKKSGNYELLAKVYDLRKQEKDFMLRFNLKYKDKFVKIIDQLIDETVDRKNIQNLQHYKNDFLELIKYEQIKGLNSSSGLLGELRDTIHSTEKYEKEILKFVLEKLKDEVNFLKTMSLIITLLIIAVILTIALLLTKTILSSLNKFEIGLTSFFKYLNHETKDVELLNNTNKDEFGAMSKLIDENIEKTKHMIEQDRLLIIDATEVANKIKEGYLDNKITKNSENEALNDLKDVINEMLINLNKNIKNILDILSSYANDNYLSKVNCSNMQGEMLELCQNTNHLGKTITKQLQDNKKVGISLIDSSNNLLQDVEKLQIGTNETAASLEETAAALEEITSTVISNNENIDKMTHYANSVTHAVKDGEVLAKETTNAMDEIDQEVSLINDSITIIDQIAFQTNILSLNAAVEAATAGEAGRGFAIVAQEVRNLASRSAEAAKEIKELVENAKSKADNGKNIATQMLEGYNTLNININETINTITDVSNASKEQQAGIEQINTAISQLDKQTQENAFIANKTQDIAKDTDSIATQIVEEVNKKEFEGK